MRCTWPTLASAVAVVVAIAATTMSTGSPTALPVVRAAVLTLLVLSVAAVLGVLVVGVHLPVADARRDRLLDVAAAAAALWAVTAAATAFLLYLGTAPSLGSPAFGPGLVSFVFEVEVGRTWLIAAVLAAVLSALLVAVRSAPGVAALWVLTAIAAVPVALQSAAPGESIAAERTVAAAGLVQLVALGTWTGALAAAGALRTAHRRPPAVGCFLALLVALGVAWPVLAADGAVSPVAIAGAVTVGLAGVLAVLAQRSRFRSFHGAELLLLAVGSGLAVAASVTRAVPDVSARTTPAEILTGAALPPVPSFPAILGSRQVDPLWLVLCVALLVGYARVALRSPGWPALRSCSWLAGVVLLAWLTSGAPAVYQGVLLGAHLVQHLALLLVVPLLLAGGAPIRLLRTSRAESGRRLRAGALAVLDSRALRLLARPAPAGIACVVVLLALYGSGALRWSVGDAVGTEVTTSACVLVGAVLVHALTAPTVHRRSATLLVGALLVVESGGALALALGSSLLLPDWFGAMGWGTDALAAQRSAALDAWVLAGVPTLVLLIRTLRATGTTSSLARPEAATA
jgi:cytochrome c oxidase assembly factor CtaG